MNRRAILGFILTFSLAYAGLSIAFHFIGSGYVRAVLPAVATVIEWTHPDWMEPSLRLSERGGREAIVFKAGIPAGTYFENGNEMLRVKRADIAVDPAIMLAQPIIVLALLLGWPFLAPRQKMRALAIALPCLLAVSVADAAIRVTDFAAQGVDAGSMSATLRGYADYFMGNGGRQFTAVLVFLASIAPFHLAPPEPSPEAAKKIQTKKKSGKKKKRKG